MLTAAASATVLLAPAYATPEPATSDQVGGALYPPSAEQVEDSPIGRALGPARYILADVGADEEFRAMIRQAIGKHPAFHMELSRRDEARGHIRAERAALFPRLSASVAGDYVIDREFGTGTDNVVESLRSPGQFNGVLSASQLLFDGGATFQRIRGARAHVRQQSLTVAKRINDLAIGALSAYHDLAVHRAIVTLGEEFIRRHDQLLSDVKERERLGVGSRADIMQAAARLAAARARVSQIRESMRFAEVRYEEYFGDAPQVLARPSYDAFAVASRDEAVSLALARSPDIGIAQAGADRARSDYRAAKASRLPEVRASVDAVKYDITENTDDYDVRAGVDLSYDIFAGGARGAAISRAGATARQQQLEEERVRQEISREAAIAYEARVASEERLAALGDAVVAHFEARALIAERFRVARGDLIDLLQAENDYFEAGVAYLIGLAEKDLSGYDLMEHTGELQRTFSPSSEYAGDAP